jgi:cytoskeletal protein CcmA (bactofilin family)
MWKPSQSVVRVSPAVPIFEAVPPSSPGSAAEAAGRPSTVPVAANHAVIGKGLVIKGEITGSESLFVDGRVEGSINIPNERVTIGQNGRVVAGMAASMNVCITAREIVIMGKITGNVSASDRVDIRAEGTLKGDVSTSRISIADGAFFTGGVDIRRAEAKAMASTAPVEEEKTA